MLNLIPTGQKNLTLANPNAMSTALDATANGTQLLRHGRICVLGDVGVGKTSLVRSLLGEEFKQVIEKTQGMDMTLVTTRTADKQWGEIPEVALPNFQRIADKSIALRLYKSDKRNPLRMFLNFLYSICCTNMLITHSTYKNLLDKTTGISVGLWLANVVRILVLNFLLWFCAYFVGLCWMGVFIEAVELTLFYELRAKGFLRWNILGIIFGCRTIRKCESIPLFHYFAGFSDLEKNVGVLVLSFLLVSLIVQPCQPKKLSFDDLHQKYVLVGFVPTYVFLCSRGFFLGTLIGWGCRSYISEQNYDRSIKIGTFVSVAIMIIFNLDKALFQVLQPPHISGDKEPTLFKRWLFLAAMQLTVLVLYPLCGVDTLYLMASIMITEATIGVVFTWFIYGEKKPQIPGLLSQFRSSELTTLSTHHFILQRHSGLLFFNNIQKLLEDSNKLRDEEEFISALRFRIQDFAGDEEYYSYHHLFILDQAIFVIVFNLTVDVCCLPPQLMFWLSSICAHSSANQLSVFLVGTHRDEVSKQKLLELNNTLKSHLLPTFGDIFECNGDLLFFAVENKHSDFDQGVKSLKQSIEETASTGNAHLVENEVPLRWLEICQLIQNHQSLIFVKESRQANTFVSIDVCLRKEDFKKFLALKELTVEDNVEFENMLHYFHRKGLILYVQRKTPARLTDKYESKQATLQLPSAIEMSDWLLLNPQILAKAEREFVLNPNKLDLQKKKMRKDWQVLKETGYISGTLLHHTLRNFSLQNVETLVAFMEVCDLICRLARPQKQRHGESVLTHFLPALLPRFTGTKCCKKVLWHNSPNDKSFYFNFHGFLPEAVFHRIIARAYTHSYAFNLKTDPQVYRNVGLFWLSKSQCYLLELIEDKGIKVTFAPVNSSDRKPSDVMAVLWSIVSDVCNSDFKFLKFYCGPACCKCSQRDDLNTTCMHHHIIDIYPKCCDEDIRHHSFICGNIELDKHELQMWFPNT